MEVIYCFFDTYKEIKSCSDLNINNLVNKLSKFALTEKFLFLLRIEDYSTYRDYLPLFYITVMLEMKEKYLSLKIIFPLIDKLKDLKFENHLEQLLEKDSFPLKLELFFKENSNSIIEFKKSEETKKITNEIDAYYLDNIKYIYSFHSLYIEIFIYMLIDIISKLANDKALKENEFVNSLFYAFNEVSYGEYHLQKEDLNLLIDYLKKNNSFNHTKNIIQIILLQLNLFKYIEEIKLKKKIEKKFFETIFENVFDNKLSYKIRWAIYEEEINRTEFDVKGMKAILEGKKTKEEILTYNIFEKINKSKSTDRNNGMYINAYRSIFTNEKIIIAKIDLEYYKKNKIFLEEIERKIKSEINSIQKSSGQELKNADNYIQIENKIINFTDSYDLFLKELKEKNIKDSRNSYK